MDEATAEKPEDSAGDRRQDKAEEEIEVTCPKCGAQFDVDAKTGAVEAE